MNSQPTEAEKWEAIHFFVAQFYRHIRGIHDEWCYWCEREQKQRPA